MNLEVELLPKQSSLYQYFSISYKGTGWFCLSECILKLPTNLKSGFKVAVLRHFQFKAVRKAKTNV